MVLSQQDAQRIVDDIKRTVGRDVNIMDETGHIVASTNPARLGQLHSGAVRVIREGLDTLPIAENDPAAGVWAGMNLPLRMDGALVGVIGVTGPPEEVQSLGTVIRQLTELMMERTRQTDQAALLDRARGLFVETWLFADQPDWADLELRGRLLDLDLAAPYTAAVLQLPGGESSPDELRSSLILRMLRTRLAADPHSCCAVTRRRMLLLLHDCTRADAAALVRRCCQDIESYFSLPVSGGISDRSQNAADVRRCYVEARTAAAAAAQSPEGRVVFYDEVSLEFIVQSIPRDIRRDLQTLVFSTCTPQEQTEFMKTVALYFAQDGDLKRCAQALFVHRNTVQYRLDALHRRTGYDLRRPRDGVLLYLAAQPLP